MSLIRIQSCRRCKFGEPMGTDGMVECRRFPPDVTAVAVPQGNQFGVAMQATFPKLQPDQYCGEWKPKMSMADDCVVDTVPIPPASPIAEAA